MGLTYVFHGKNWQKFTAIYIDNYMFITSLIFAPLNKLHVLHLKISVFLSEKVCICKDFTKKKVELL